MAGAKRPSDETEQRESKRVRSSYSEILTVVVGTAEHKFHVHQDLICNKSTFFKAALSSWWREAISKTITLREHQPAAFKIYLETLYTPDADLLELARSYTNEMTEDDEDDFGTAGDRRKTALALVKLYVLGDFLNDMTFKSDIFRAVVRGCKDRKLKFGKGAQKVVFEQTAADCSLQKFIADITSIKLTSPNQVDGLCKQVSPNLVMAVCKALVDIKHTGRRRIEWAAEKYLGHEGR